LPEEITHHASRVTHHAFAQFSASPLLRFQDSALANKLGARDNARSRQMEAGCSPNAAPPRGTTPVGLDRIGYVRPGAFVLLHLPFLMRRNGGRAPWQIDGGRAALAAPPMHH
jgi:hypothetical protein